MKALVKTYLNIRTDHPEIGLNNNPGYYVPGEEIEVTETVIGHAYKGNNIWYRLANNAFVWSGGIDGIEFAWDERSFSSLNQQQQYDVLLLAKAYYGPKMLSDHYGVTGIYIGKKIKEEVALPMLTLSFQVSKKSDTVPWKKIPAILPFKGYAIPTDVVEANLMKMQERFPGDTLRGRPGGSLSRLNREDWGSCAFVAEKKIDGVTNYFLVTNFHVAAFDLLEQRKYSYSSALHADLIPMVMPSWLSDSNEGNQIGFLYKGLFDEWHDTALILIPDETKISNILSGNIRIAGSLSAVDDLTFIGEFVTMYGGFSGKIINKRIISVNSSQRVIINDEEFIKNELIQVERMSEGGDSGSPVLVGDQLIGIVIGADDDNTYVLSAEKIISFFNIKISNK